MISTVTLPDTFTEADKFAAWHGVTRPIEGISLEYPHNRECPHNTNSYCLSKIIVPSIGLPCMSVPLMATVLVLPSFEMTAFPV
jgi:hypothetical protein